MRTNDLQAQLPLGETGSKREPIPLDPDKLRNKPTYHAALLYVIECGNFQKDKQLYRQLGIDAGNWTRIKQGEMSFPQDKEDLLQDLCGNDGLAVWRAYKRGKGTFDLHTELERENALLRHRVVELERDIQAFVKHRIQS